MEQKKLNLRALFKALEDIPYFLIKMDAPYMVDGFPDSYPEGKDLDIVTTPEHFKAVMRALGALDPAGWHIRTFADESNCRIRFEHEPGRLHYQFDVTCKYPWHLEEDFLKSCLENRVQENGYYVLPPEYESAFRLYETVHEPQKKHHHRWVKEHKHLARKTIIPNDLYRYLP